MSVKTAWPSIGWVLNPNTRSRPGMAHASDRRTQIALCGASTPYLGERWPQRDEPWPSSYSRCPSCAHRLYAGRF